MQEKRTEIVKYQGLVKTIPSHLQLMKVNRILMGFVLFLMLLIVIFGFFFIPSSDAFFEKQKALTETILTDDSNPVVSAEVNNLKGQMVGLVSGSIEAKLKDLEENIKLGATGNSLDTIADLKNDIKVLRTYSDSPKKAVVVSNQEIVQEISHLKKLIYMTIGSCGLMFFAAAGVWVKSRRLPNREMKRFLGGK